MTKQLKYFIVFLLIISCKNNDIERPKVPKNLIPKDSMVEIIHDISLINSAKGVSRQLLESNGIIPEEYVYKKHNIDSLQFALSNDYYAYDLKSYEDIYKSVKLKLENDKKTIQSIIYFEKKERDSINKSNRDKKLSKKDLQLKKNPF